MMVNEDEVTISNLWKHLPHSAVDIVIIIIKFVAFVMFLFVQKEIDHHSKHICKNLKYIVALRQCQRIKLYKALTLTHAD